MKNSLPACVGMKICLIAFLLGVLNLPEALAADKPVDCESYLVNCLVKQGKLRGVCCVLG